MKTKSKSLFEETMPQFIPAPCATDSPEIGLLLMEARRLVGLSREFSKSVPASKKNNAEKMVLALSWAHATAAAWLRCRLSNEFGGLIRAPFTPEQLKGLKAWQKCDWVHAFTCCGSVPMMVSAQGFACPACHRVQFWAHAFMANGAPPHPAKLLKRQKK